MTAQPQLCRTEDGSARPTGATSMRKQGATSTRTRGWLGVRSNGPDSALQSLPPPHPLLVALLHTTLPPPYQAHT